MNGSRPEDLSHAEIRRLISRLDPVILEIGSNDGADTNGFLEQHQGGRVFCFECDPRAIAKWRRNVTDPRAELFEFALDERDGEATFNQSGGEPPGQRHPKGWDMSGSLCRPTGHLEYSPWCKFETTITVRTRTLDGWAAERLASGPIDFIWIDVQGAEGRVFRAGAKTLARTRYVKVEVHRGEMYEGQPDDAEMGRLLSGWSCLGRYGDDLLFRNPEADRAS